MSDRANFLRFKKSILFISVITLLCFFFWNSLPFFFLAVAAGISPIFLYYGLTHPYFFCIIFYMFSVFRLHEVIPGLYPYKLPFITAALSIASLILNVLMDKTKLYWQEEMRYFLIFFVFITLTVPLSYSFSISYAYWSQSFLKIGIIFFLTTWSITDKLHFKYIILVTIFCGSTLALITIYNKQHGINLVEGTRATITSSDSVISDPNDLALTLLLPLSFCWSLFSVKSKSVLARLSGFCSSLLIIEAIIATQSRGGLLGLGGVMGYFASRRFKSKILFLIVGSLTAVLLFGIAHVSSRQSGGATEGGIDESSMGRIYAWGAAINMAWHHPLTGVGLNGFEENLYQYAIVWEKMNRAVHSSWFGVLAESGFIGLALFITMVYQALKLARKNIRLTEELNAKYPYTLTTEIILARSLYAGLIGFCISSTFLTQGYAWPLYVFFALSISLSHELLSRQINKIGD